MINISGKINSDSIELYSAVDTAAKKCNVPYVVVGASARDLVLHYGYGARIKRATADIDFGIQVPDWDSFSKLKEQLISAGFSETEMQHRLISSSAYLIDIIPFGSLQDDRINISWPPKGEVIMNVLGFQEVAENAIKIKIQEEPVLEIPVATPPGLSLLKIISWTARDADLRNKDAKDLLFLMKTYEEAPDVLREIFKHPEMMDNFDHDITLGATWLLGKHAGNISSDASKTYINNFKTNGINARNHEILIEEMCEDIEQEYDRNEKLLTAWFDGFNDND